MGSAVSGLAGYRGLKGEVLLALRIAQPLTAKELGERFGVTANALRRHLRALESEGLVEFRKEARGVGGPVYAYSLTDLGDALFPRAYAPLLTGLLRTVRDEAGSDAVERFVLEQMRRLAAEAGPHLAKGTPAERARRIAELLSAQGYMAEAIEDASDGTLRIVEHNCAMHEVAREFPEVCAAEARFLAELVDGEVEREHHMLAGCNRCEYRVKVGH